MHPGLTTAIMIWYQVTTAVSSSSTWTETTASTSMAGSSIQTASPVNGLNSTAPENHATAGNTTACDPPPQPVSAASALWALIALAINAMTQRSGADRRDVLSPARSSPLVCLADVVVVVLWLAHGMRQGLGVKASMYWYRKEMGLLREKSDRRLIEGIPAVTIFFFILGPSLRRSKPLVLGDCTGRRPGLRCSLGLGALKSLFAFQLVCLIRRPWSQQLRDWSISPASYGKYH